MRRVGTALLVLTLALAASGGQASADTSTAQRVAAHTPQLVQAGDGLSAAVARGTVSPAKAALLRAQALFHPNVVQRSTGLTIAAGGQDATPIMADLSHYAWRLQGADRTAAERLLARPDEGGGDPLGDGWTTPEAPASPVCDPNFCVHWTATGTDAPPTGDDDADGVPDWVDQTLATLQHAWSVEVGTLGYRQPKSDATSADNGGDGRLDVYLADVGSDGVFGYVNSDDPHLDNPQQYGFFDESTYMVLDNNMSSSQFGGLAPLDSLQVTVAHEFFHTIQGAYDWWEDHWLMEGTATWMEDVVYDSDNQNRDYLGNSLLTHPTTSLDSSAGAFWYGSWLWYEFLTEWIGTRSAPAVNVIKGVWQFADGSPGGPDNSSMQAIKSELAVAGQHHPLAWAFADFAMWNRDKALYQEGASLPAAPSAQQFHLGPTRKSTRWLSARINHLTYLPAALVPGTRQPRGGHVTIRFDLPPTSIGSAARVIVRFTGGKVVLHRVTLNSKGNGSLRVAFGHGTTSSVLVILINGSGRYTNCFTAGTQWSCAGTPVDQGKTESFNATLS
jgi:hypothetical protein